MSTTIGTKVTYRPEINDTGIAGTVVAVYPGRVAVRWESDEDADVEWAADLIPAT